MLRILPAALLIITSLMVFPAQAQTSLPDSLRVVVLGSSTAAGAGASPRDSAWVWKYRAYLESINPAYEVINLAVGGYTTYQIQPDDFVSPEGRPYPDTLKNITEALARHADAIIINLPSNDAASGFSILEQAKNFERVTALADSAGVPIWVCTTQPRNLSETGRQNLIVTRDWILERYGERALDFWTTIGEEEGRIVSTYNSGDGVHLNNAGHHVLFTRVRDAGIPAALGGTSFIAEAAAPLSPELSVYPQPARHTLSVRYRLHTPAACSLHLTDIQGRELLRKDLHPLSTSEHHVYLPMSDLPRGIYHLILRTGTHVTATAVLHM
ncbi:SGNH/GDSL hydrolase family protein [bacterium]|nr:SGNH/GDSL hydrolase family protein [bacterium]